MNLLGITIGVLLVLLLALGIAGRLACNTDWGHPLLNVLEGLNRLFCRYYHRLPEANLPLPAEGPALVVSNHVSGVDPMLLIAASPRPLRFIIAREEYERPWLKWLYRAVGFIPVDRTGQPERAFWAARRALESGEVVALFPQGRLEPEPDPDRPLKRGVLLLARLAEVPIYPVRVAGVSRPGTIFAAVFRRGHARLTLGEPIDAVGRSDNGEALWRIKAAIEGWTDTERPSLGSSKRTGG